MESMKKADADEVDSFGTDEEEKEVKDVKKAKNVNLGKQQKAGSSKAPADLVTLLHESIQNLNTKFDKFNESVSGKISAIERNYQQLNARIDMLTMEESKMVSF